MKTMRVSDINSYLYCQRSWWYQNSGYQSENLKIMATGQAIHERHGRSVQAVSRLRALAASLLLISLGLFAVYLYSLLF